MFFRLLSPLSNLAKNPFEISWKKLETHAHTKYDPEALLSQGQAENRIPCKQTETEIHTWKGKGVECKGVLFPWGTTAYALYWHRT